LMEVNPFIAVDAMVESFKTNHVTGYDLVLDCTDNMATKYFIHDVCFKNKVPLISAGVYKFEGQVRTFIPEQGCLRCYVTETPDDSLLGNCNDFGVLGATTSVLGSIQAAEAVEFLVNGKNATFEATLHLNVKTLSQMKIKNTAKADCPVCMGKHEIKTIDLEVDTTSEGRVVDIREMSDEEISQLNFTSEKIILACHRGVRSKKVAEALRAQGHAQVYSLKGGAQTCSHKH
jgi:rhodanese-related sulfurtransferase